MSADKAGANRQSAGTVPAMAELLLSVATLSRRYDLSRSRIHQMRDGRRKDVQHPLPDPAPVEGTPLIVWTLESILKFERESGINVVDPRLFDRDSQELDPVPGD